MREDEHSNPGQGGEEIAWLDLIPIYEAPNEDSAIHVQAWLASDGIPARVRSAQIPGFDGAFAMAVGFWGQVMVPRESAERARELVRRLLADAGGGGRVLEAERGP